MRKYYLHDGKESSGPFSLEELRDMNVDGNVSVWYKGLKSWNKISELEELNDDVQLPEYTGSNESSMYSEDFYRKTSQRSKLVLAFSLIFIFSLGVWFLYSNKKEDNKIPDPFESEIANVSVSEFPEQPTVQDEEPTVVVTKKKKASKSNDDISQRTAFVQDSIARWKELNKDKNYRNNWKRYIQTSITYDHKTLGGLANLNLNVRNNAPYPLDQVNVKVMYYKSNGDIYQTEFVLVSDIPAHGGRTVKAPESKRGKSVKTEIQTIKASSFYFCYPNGSGAEDDPFVCN